jgi:hypothetical protein
LLQEEVSEGEPVSHTRQADHRYVKLPLKSVPVQQQSSGSRPPSRSEDQRGIDSAQATADERVTALRAFRRAKGLCYKCGERWRKEHTCPASVQLHIVEELFELFSSEELNGSDTETQTPDETVCSISIHAMTGSSANSPGVIQLQAFVADKEILLLVDSGSSTSFINKHLAATLTGVQPLSRPCRVNVADGTQYKCSTYIPQYSWSANDYVFHTDMKVLPLGAFDTILGMDWLEEHNPDIDWVAKTLKIKGPAGEIQLQGHKSNNIQCSAISSNELSHICKAGSVAHLVHLYALDGEIHVEEIVPAEIQGVLDQFASVFATPANCLTS